MKKTKIICTLGPASEDVNTLTTMIKSGMNVARLNFSHGTYDNHLALMKNIRDVSKKLNIPVAIMQDLQGPKIRVAKFKNGKVFLKENAEFVLDAALAKDAGDENAVGIDCELS